MKSKIDLIRHNSRIFLLSGYKYGIYLIIILSLLNCSCKTKYKSTELIEGTFYPNGKVILEGMPINNLFKMYDITLTEPTRVIEIGEMKASFFIDVYKGNYLKNAGNKFVKIDFSEHGQFYVPVSMLNNTGRFEYHKRILGPIEWIQYHPVKIFSYIAILVILAIDVIIIQSKKKRKILYEKEEKD